MTIHRILQVGVLSSCFLCAGGYAQNAAKPAPTTTRPKSEIDVINDGLNSRDPAEQQAAVDRIKELIGDPQDIDDSGKPKPAKYTVQGKWLTSLMKAKRYDDVDAFAVNGILRAAGQTNVLADLQRTRIQSLMAAGKYDAALSAAKAYYNVCKMADTEAAIDFLCAALVKARTNEKGLAKKFKAQQIALAAAPTTQPAGNTASPAGENLLKSITIDAKPFEASIADRSANDINGLLAKGNLYLLCDRAKEARECFESASEMATDPKQSAMMTESVARAIRAETGAIGPANAYILAQQGK